VWNGEIKAEFPVFGLVNITDTTPDVPPDADPIVGAFGFDVGTTAAEAADAGDDPIAFLAVTVKV